MCPFECTCEKHHDQKHVGIDIAPQKPDTEGGLGLRGYKRENICRQRKRSKQD